MNRKIKFLVFIIIFSLCGCGISPKETFYNKAKCGDNEYDIISIMRWSESNYTLTLVDGRKIEVHPMNCMFYYEENANANTTN